MIIPVPLHIQSSPQAALPIKVVLAGIVEHKVIGRFTFALDKSNLSHTTQVSRMELWPEGHQFQILSTSVMKQDGFQVQDEDVETEDGTDSASVIAVYTKQGADFTDRVTKTKKLYPLPKGWSLDDPSEAWFIFSKPKVGAASTYCAFSTDKRKWIKRTRTYTGDTTIVVGGKKVTGHWLVVKDNDDGSDFSMVVDDQGMPLKFDAQGIEFIRTEDTPEPPGIS